MRLIDADHLDKRIYEEIPLKEFGTIKRMARMREIIEEEPTVGGWISVKERMPEPPAQCLVYSDKRRPRGMETATYTEFGWMTAAYFPEITHWMPLPEPPEEVSGDG